MKITYEIITVGMADLNIAASPNRLKTIGLGSCIGLVLFDEKAKIAGMAHIMLPSSNLNKESIIKNDGKYADTAIPTLIKEMEKRGAIKSRMVAKMAGGAQMFVTHSYSDTMKIGLRNAESCRELLKKENIPLISEETGGNFGRTVEFDTMTGMLSIKTLNQSQIHEI